MKIDKGMKSDALIELIAKLHMSADEASTLRALEQSGKSAEFKEALLALDRKERLRQLKNLEGVDKKKLSPNAFRVMTSLDQVAQRPMRWQKPWTWPIETLKPLKALNYAPLIYSGSYVSNAMSGPDKPDPEIFEGIMGVLRKHHGQYMVWNPGDPSWGKTRISISGQVSVDFSGVLPMTADYSLFFDPRGNTLVIKGYSRVIGEGDSTCSYDAKVWVRLGMGVEVAGTLVDYSDEQIHYDGTRSEDRKVYFDEPRFIEPRSVSFSGNRGDTVKLKFLLDIEASANKEGSATGVVDMFGFIANSPADYRPAVVGNVIGPHRS